MNEVEALYRQHASAVLRFAWGLSRQAVVAVSGSGRSSAMIPATIRNGTGQNVDTRPGDRLVGDGESLRQRIRVQHSVENQKRKSCNTPDENLAAHRLLLSTLPLRRLQTLHSCVPPGSVVFHALLASQEQDDGRGYQQR